MNPDFSGHNGTGLQSDPTPRAELEMSEKNPNPRELIPIEWKWH